MVTTDLVHPQAHSVLQAFRPVPRTGVIYVTTEAQARGYRAGDPAWANLGQGQPETGPLPGAPPRVEAVAIDPGDQEYAPIAGLPELRDGGGGALQPPLPARHAVAVQRRERRHLRRRPRVAHPRGGGAGADQPRPLPPRLHRLRGAARHLPAGVADPDPAQPRAAVPLHRRRPAPRGTWGGGWGRCCCPTPATRWASWSPATRWPSGWRWPGRPTAPCCSTSSTPTSSGGPAPARPGRWSAPPATSRTSTATRW